MAWPTSTGAPTLNNDGEGGVPKYPSFYTVYGPPWQFSPSPAGLESYDTGYDTGYDAGYAVGFADGGGGGGGVPTSGQTWPRGNP